MGSVVTVSEAEVVLPTYVPGPPERYPQFLDHRVYQGSSGRVYPLPVVDRIADQPVPQAWRAVYVENDFLRVMILPELGGRIHRIVDRATGRDLIYHQPVIKPALVGLAGPWVSGGIEFNWPQHHRPSTAMPTEVAVEHGGDGSVTVWLSEHEPMARMKGMHGVCLHPEYARLELRARVFNRTDDVQTFLWWANVGLEAHEQYQSFFPPDVRFVADHAKRAMTTFPLSEGVYYGVDYGARARAGVAEAERPRQYRPPDAGAKGQVAYAPNDLSWYANIPVPTSYMCVGSTGDFCGGYDHRAGIGLVHVADHRIAPGKKQWTWGNQEFGYAWDRNLTDARVDGSYPPYIELMAGVFTDNQPDFSFLQPGETKQWSQYWYPIHCVGVPREANPEAAVDLRVAEAGRRLEVRVAVVRKLERAQVQVVAQDGRVVARRQQVDLGPAQPLIRTWRLGRAVEEHHLRLEVRDAAGRLVIAYQPAQRAVPVTVPEPASAPVVPQAMGSADELYLAGLHLEQYRHATRSPVAYWAEALRRDPGDSRCALALGRWHLRRGEWAEAERWLRVSIARLTARNPNPADGEAHYQLGRCLRYVGRDAEADEAWAKSAWNQAWAGAANLGLAELAVARQQWNRAEAAVRRARALDADNLRARNLHSVILRATGRAAAAGELLDEILALDPLDAWARWQRDGWVPGDAAMGLDVAHDLGRAGQWEEALAVLGGVVSRREPADTAQRTLVDYTRAWLWERCGRPVEARRARRAAQRGRADGCFPARLEDLAVLQAAVAADPRDARARTLLGFWLYDRRRRQEAMAHWAAAVKRDPASAVAWRCLGMAEFNVAGDATRARRCYEQAIRAEPDTARLRYERDQLWKRCGVAPAQRLRALEFRLDLVAQRDDLVVELATLLNQVGRPEQALRWLLSRTFQPWEGGEGAVSGQYVRARLLLGRAALSADRVTEARAQFAAALELPATLGEARHLLANPSDVHWWQGEAAHADGDRVAARQHWQMAAERKGDFQSMAVRTYSEMTTFSARALKRLGRPAQARKLDEALRDYALRLAVAPAEVDYFATSLPTMLLFSDDLAARQVTTARFLEAQALAGLGDVAGARRRLADVLRRDPNHGMASDLAAELGAGGAGV